MGEGAEHLEDHLVLDEAGLLQLVGHVAHRVALLNLHRGGEGGLVQGQHVVGPHPAHPRQNGGDAQHKNDIEQHAPRAQALFPPAAGGGAPLTLRMRGGHPLPAVAGAPVLGGAAFFVPIFFLRHGFHSNQTKGFSQAPAPRREPPRIRPHSMGQMKQAR